MYGVAPSQNQISQHLYIRSRHSKHWLGKPPVGVVQSALRHSPLSHPRWSMDLPTHPLDQSPTLQLESATNQPPTNQPTVPMTRCLSIAGRASCGHGPASWPTCHTQLTLVVKHRWICIKNEATWSFAKSPIERHHEIWLYDSTSCKMSPSKCPKSLYWNLAIPYMSDHRESQIFTDIHRSNKQRTQLAPVSCHPRWPTPRS